MIRINQFAPLGRVIFRKQSFKRDFCKRRICVKFRAIGPRDFLCLDHRVQCLGRIASHRSQIESFENVQNLQRGDSLSVRRQFKNIISAIIHRNRIDPRARVLFKIVFAQKSAVLVHEHVDLVRDLAFIESVATFLANQSQRLGQRRILENVAFRRSAAFAIERVGFEKRARQFFVESGPNASKTRSAR